MTLAEVAKVIVDSLAQIDDLLQTPGLSDADRQELYALRKHLDDLRRELTRKPIDETSAQYQVLANQLKNASAGLKPVIADVHKASSLITTTSQIVAYVQQILSCAYMEPLPKPGPKTR